MAAIIGLEFIIHVVLIEILNRIARKSQWFVLAPFALVVSGFMIYIILTIPVITPSGLEIVPGTLQTTGLDKNGWFAIELNNNPLQFVVSENDSQYFQKESFMRNVHTGDQLNISILKRTEKSTDSYRLIFELESKGIIYLPHEPLLKDRVRERVVTFPIVIIISIFLGLTMIIAWRYPHPLMDLVLSGFLATLVMVALDTIFRKSNIPGVLPAIFLAIIYPAIWIFENRRKQLTRKEWLLNLAFYFLILGFGVFSSLFALMKTI